MDRLVIVATGVLLSAVAPPALAQHTAPAPAESPAPSRAPVTSAAPSSGQGAGEAAGRAGRSARLAVFTVADARLAAAIGRIEDGSAAWRAALDSVVAAGGAIIVAGVDEVVGVPEPFARAELAAVSPVVQADSAVAVVMVVINTPLLERVYRLAAAGPSAVHPRDLSSDLVRLLVHEIFGHAVPYLLAGHVRGACPDPTAPGLSACSVERENVVRRELGLGTRRGYDLSGLALSRYIAARDAP